MLRFYRQRLGGTQQVISDNIIYCISGLNADPLKVKEVVMQTRDKLNAEFLEGESLVLKLYGRIGTLPGGRCSGLSGSNKNGLKLYYDAPIHLSRFNVTFDSIHSN